MNASTIAALVYTLGIAGIILFQCGLIAGAPWGRLTQGGRHEGALPVSGRIIAFMSIPTLLGMGAGITSAAGLSPNFPLWVSWVALGIQLMSTILNWITPSYRERMLWGPVMIVMLSLAGFVMFNVYE